MPAFEVQAEVEVRGLPGAAAEAAIQAALTEIHQIGQLTDIAGETPDRVRTSPLDNGAAEALADWVEVRDYGPGPLFLPTVRGGALRLRRTTETWPGWVPVASTRRWKKGTRKECSDSRLAGKNLCTSSGNGSNKSTQ